MLNDIMVTMFDSIIIVMSAIFELLRMYLPEKDLGDASEVLLHFVLSGQLGPGHYVISSC